MTSEGLPVTLRRAEGAHRPTLSVVIPIFNEEGILPELYRRLSHCLWAMERPAEMVFVDDGSTDRSPQRLDEFAATNPQVRVVHLSRNFGLSIAVTAGLDHAAGELIALMDGDLQDVPEELPRLIATVEEGYDVAYAIRTRRKESMLKRAAVFAFYRVLSAMAATPLPVDAGLFSVMTRSVAEALRSLPERTRYVSGLRAWVGFKQCGVPIERQARSAGRPRQTLRRLSRLAIDGLVSFSYLPLRLATWVGVVTALLSATGVVWAMYVRLTTAHPPPGWASIVLIILFLGSVQLLGLGVIGEYIGRVYDEVKARPLYIVRERKGFRKGEVGGDGDAQSDADRTRRDQVRAA